MSVDLDTLLARLAETGIPATVLQVGPDAQVVVSSYGARVYGPFFGSAASSNWIPEAAHSSEAWADLVASGAWNLGGDRTWIGPEVTFMVADRSDYWGSLAVPSAIDPGIHVVLAEGEAVVLDRSASLEAHTEPAGRADVALRLRVVSAPSPLRHLREGHPLFGRAAEYAGYTIETELTVTAGLPVEAESWTLQQVHAGGTALVATTFDPQVTDYYEPVGPLLHEAAGGVAVDVTGADRFKIGFSAVSATGRLGYLTRSNDGTSTLLARYVSSDASADYGEEPDFAPGDRGDSLHLYNDDGALGGFAEMESRGRPVTATTAGASGRDRFSTWWFRGEHDVIDLIARTLVGVDPESVPGLEPEPVRPSSITTSQQGTSE